MPFCPECKCEYRKGFSSCNDCGVELVDVLREEKLKEEIRPEPGQCSSCSPEYAGEFILLASDMPQDEFLFTRNILEGSGIPVLVSDTVYQHKPSGFNFIKVPSSRYQVAVSLLEAAHFERGAKPAQNDLDLEAQAMNSKMEDTGGGLDPKIMFSIMAVITLLVILLLFMQNN